jgi:hypothetical protein
MKTLLGFALLVLVLLGAGLAFRRAAAIEDSIAAADEQLVTTTRVAPDLDRQLDESVALVRRVPVLGARLSREVRLQRASANYWQGNYAALASTATGTTGIPEDDDAELLLLSANASFRKAVKENRTPQALARSLDDVLKGYGAALKADPESTTAAYNYEYVVRLRTALTSGRGATMPAPRQMNMQGEQGEPPKGSRQSDFNVIVPLRPEERQEQLDPGAGAEFKRKG